MLSFILTLQRLIKSLAEAFKDEETKALLGLTLALLASGTFFYTTVEKFSILDAFYFSFMTLTTVGYGDLAPSTAIGKLFSVFYVMLGLGIISLFVARIAKGYIDYSTRQTQLKKKVSNKNLNR